MKYIELIIDFKEVTPFVDVLKQELADIGFDSFVDSNSGFSAFISTSNLPEKEISLLLYHHDHIIESYSFKEHPYQNWNEHWESSFHPVFITNECVIRASFHQDFNCDYDIIINPEMSFGTGHHETTRLMSKYLLDNKPNNDAVLDFGSGTGVLSILSEKLNAKSVDAVEIDENAVQNAIQNGEINNCKKIRFIHGSSDAIPNMAYDLLLANINKNTIMSNWDSLLGVTHKKTSIVLSGFYKEDLSDLIEFTSRNGLIPLYSSSENNWAILILKYANNDV